MTDTLARHCRVVGDALGELPFDLLDEVEEALLDCHRRGNTVFIVGNGGSAATASHFACDLSKGTRQEGVPRFRVVALTDNIPLLTAWANDANYDCIFAEQLTALVRQNDVVVLISASGNSPNIVEAARAANDAGATTIALTGRTGGTLAGIAEVVVRVPLDRMEGVEDGHMVITHALCVALRERLRSSLMPSMTAPQGSA